MCYNSYPGLGSHMDAPRVFAFVGNAYNTRFVQLWDDQKLITEGRWHARMESSRPSRAVWSSRHLRDDDPLTTTPCDCGT